MPAVVRRPPVWRLTAVKKLSARTHGARSPSVESLVMGAHPGLPRVILHHPVVTLESEIEEYKLVFEQTKAKALSPRQSAQHIKKMMKGIHDE